MEDYISLSSSNDEEELQLLSTQQKVRTSQKMSKHLQYFYRRTKDKRKRKYTLFTDQENPSRQLKRYYPTMANSSGVSMDLVASESLPLIIVTTVNLRQMHIMKVLLITVQKMMTLPSMPHFLCMKVIEKSPSLSEGDSSRFAFVIGLAILGIALNSSV